MTTVARIAAEVGIRVTGFTFRIVIFIKPEVGAMIKGRRNPFAGAVAFIAIVFELAVIGIRRLLVAPGAIVFCSTLNHLMIKTNRILPAICIVAVAAGRGQLEVKTAGRPLMAAAAVREQGFGKQRMIKMAQCNRWYFPFMIGMTGGAFLTGQLLMKQDFYTRCIRLTGAPCVLSDLSQPVA